VSTHRRLWERLADWDFAFQVLFIVVMFILGFVWWLLDR